MLSLCPICILLAPQCQEQVLSSRDREKVDLLKFSPLTSAALSRFSSFCEADDDVVCFF